MPEKHKEKIYDVGVIIGRFQVDELHDGHRFLIESVIEKHEKVVILIGVARTLGTFDNPLDYVTRAGLFEKYLNPNVIIQPIWDVPCDEVWSANVDNIVRTIVPLGAVRLYGGRDSFVDHYHGTFDTFEYQIVTDKDGTQIRENVGKSTVNNPDFRKGVIYSTQNRYPKVHATVDVAVIRDFHPHAGDSHYETQVLLGKKVNGTGLSFIGGFVDPTDDKLEISAIRELREEVDLEVGNITYVSSQIIDDWRYRDPKERIMTTFFVGEYIFGNIRANEEFETMDWYDLSQKNIPITKTHAPLLKALRKHLNLEVD